jgi:hypothetical protein
LAGVDGASGFCSGGRGSGLSEPGGVGSIKCFSLDKPLERIALHIPVVDKSKREDGTFSRKDFRF